MRRYVGTIIAFASILGLGIIGILVGNNLDWFEANGSQPARTECFDKNC